MQSSIPDAFIGIARLCGVHDRLQHVPSVRGVAVLHGQCYSAARALVQEGSGKAYVEGLLATDGVPLPVGHAWFVNDKDEHVDVTRVSGCHQYFGVAVPAAEFNANMARPEFVLEFDRHDMFPYCRALQAVRPVVADKHVPGAVLQGRCAADCCRAFATP